MGRPNNNARHTITYVFIMLRNYDMLMMNIAVRYCWAQNSICIATSCRAKQSAKSKAVNVEEQPLDIFCNNIENYIAKWAIDMLPHNI